MTDKEYKELTRSRTAYEWGVELVIDDESEDIDDTFYFDAFAEAKQEAEKPREGYRNVVVLIREQGSESLGVTDRQWAYLEEDGTLPEEFDGGSRIPKRFHQEVAKA
jgi:hypothetical protein